MAKNSKIEWCDHTFNPWIGCTKVSPACDHCYAEARSKRVGEPQLWQGARRRTTPANWRQPLKWNAEAAARGVRYRVFCASLADVFDNVVDPKWRYDLFALIAYTPHLDWLLLTKRIGNARSMMDDIAVRVMHRPRGEWAPMPNVWLGATIANQEEADRDIPKLLATPARIRFLSCEPLLGPITFEGRWVEHADPRMHENWLEALDWVIAGGESGGGARPSHPQWFRDLRDQCVAARVPFLFKQWGNWLPGEVVPGGDLGGDIRAGRAQFVSATPWDGLGHVPPNTRIMRRFDKAVAGRELDGLTWDQFPEVV